MNIPNHFDIEQKLLSDKSSRCNKVMLKLYYMIVCFLKSFVLIALALAIIMILFKQIGVEIEFEKLVKNVFKNSTTSQKYIQQLFTDIQSNISVRNSTKV